MTEHLIIGEEGDSCGEGGSGSLWLKRQNIHGVCDKLINKGLFVSDGSDGAQFTRKGGVYGQIYDHRKSKIKDPEELIRTIKPFVDDRGHHFRCVGYAGVRYGPTMIWQVTKPE
jgi:hypothetical protein